VNLGHRQRAILLYVLRQVDMGTPPASINEVSMHNAEEPWHQTSNSEAARQLVAKGLLRLDPDHDRAHPRGRGAVLLTDEGRTLAELLDTKRERFALR
jgi:hypothetical protein